MTVSVENFVKAIYRHSIQTESNTKLSTIAAGLNISSAAATDMARNLAGKKLVHYIKYKPLSLTETGKNLALSVIRKHRLWESFLYQTLGLSMHEIHREAEHLEHLTSDFLAEKIDAYLNYPSTDPHGDPIPNLHGEIIKDESQELLWEVMPNQNYEICRLYSSDKEFFEFCHANKLLVGATIRVEKQYKEVKMTEVIVNQQKMVLNQEFTNLIYLKKKKK